MRIRRLEIEQFGIFVGHELELAGNAPHVIYGPNEAGKSTLLQLIREVLFGFTVRNPYAFADHTGEMAAVAELELADGTHVRFRRRKGRRNEVVGEQLGNGQSIDAGALQRLLGGASPELFQNVFGFSLAELAAGQQSLNHARLSEALYGGAMGSLTGFQQVLDRLEKEQDSLFSPAATKKPINHLISGLRRQAKDLRAALVRPRDYERSAKELGELQEQVERLRSRRDALQRRRARCAQLVQAASLWRERALLRFELEELEVPASFPRDGQQQYERARATCDQVAAELEDFQQELSEVDAQLEQLTPQADLIDKASKIKQLAQQLDKIRSFRRDIVLRQQESQAVKAAVLASLQELDPSWTLEHLQTFRIDVAQGESITALQEEHEALEQRQRSLHAQRPALETDIADMERQLEMLPDEDVALPLAELVEQAPAYETRRERLESFEQQQCELGARIEVLRRKLNVPFARTLDNVSDLSVPLTSTVEEFRAQLSALEQRRERSALRLERARDEWDERKQELAALQLEDQVADRTQLDEARVRRQRGWELVRRKYIDRQDVSQEELAAWLASRSDSLADQYEESVDAADQIADQRQAHAEIVARLDQLTRAIAQGQERCRAEEEAYAAHLAEREGWEQRWNDLWRPSGIEPESPDAMLQWLKLHGELIDSVAQAEALRRQGEGQREWIEAYERKLHDALQDSPASYTAQIAEARRRVQLARDAAAERRTYVTQLPRKQHQLATLQQELADLNLQFQQWQARWKVLLESCGFPATWDVHTVTKVLHGLGQARAQQREAAALDVRVADMQEGLEQFEHDVAELCRELAPQLVAQPAENAVEELVQRLEETRQQLSDQQAMMLQRAKLETRCAAKEKQLKKEQARIDRLLELAEVNHQEELPALAARVCRRFEAEDAIATLEHQLRAIRGDEDPAEFEAALEQVDETELESQQQMIKVELDQLESEFQEALQRQGVAVKELQELDQTSRAAALVQEIESARSQLVDHVDRWAPLVLARTFMRRAIERFEREHQPQLLVDVSRLLQRMTAGRYTEISRKLDEESSLLVHQADGRAKEPHQLSTGTREQLYLAIRLAYVLHYCRDAEPLPIVMDDVLVNFDDQRSAETLRALVEVSQQLQVILLTCHQQTVELVRSELPGLEPIVLGG